MDIAGATLTALGATLVALGFLDVFLTIFHPDREGPLARALARGIWRGAIEAALRWRAPRRELLALAGPIMLIATLLLWVATLVLGFALLILPRMPESYAFSNGLRPASFVDAVYYAGVAFTTLGFGDVTPLDAESKLLSFAIAASGFALMTSAITYVLNVYDGMEHRDRLTMRMLGESDDTCDGVHIVVDALRHEDERALAVRIDAWARDVRRLQEKLYRFQNIAFYLRSRPVSHDPEPALAAVADTCVASLLLAESGQMERLGPAARHLEVAYRHFTDAVGRRIVRDSARAKLESPELTDDDARHVRDVWARLAEARGMPVEPPPPEKAPRAWRLVARSRLFLDELNRVTRWRDLRGERS